MPAISYILTDLPASVIAYFEERDDGHQVIVGNSRHLSEPDFRAAVAAHGWAVDLGARRKAQDPR